MKKYIIALAFICYGYSSIAQSSKIDSLNLELSNANTLVDSVNIINQIAGYYSLSDKRKFTNYVYITDSLAQKSSNAYIKGISFKLKSSLANSNKEHEKSIFQAEKALKEFIKIKDTSNINKSLYSLFRSYRNLSQINKVIETYKKYNHLLTPKWEFEYHYQSARYYLNANKHQESISSLKSAINMSEVLKDKQLLGKSHYKMGQVFNEIKNYDKAIENHTIALNTLNPKKNFTLYGSVFTSLADVYKNKKEHRIALRLHDSALAYYKVKNKRKSISKVYSSKSISFLQIKEFDSAIFYNRKAIKLHINLNEERPLAYAYSRLANVFYYGFKKNDSAIYYVKKSLAIAKKYDLKTQIKVAHYNLNNFLYEEGKYKEARNNLYEAYKYADTLYDEKLNNKLDNIELELRRVEDKNIILQKEKDLALEREISEKQKNTILNTRIYLLIVGLLLAIGTAIALFFRKRTLQQQITLNQKFKEIRILKEEVENSLKNISKKDKEFTVLKGELTELQKTSQNRKINLRSETFDNFLKLQYKLTKKNLDYWDRQAYGLSKKEMAELWEITISAVEDRRKSLYRKLSIKTGVKDYTRFTSVSLYFEELNDFKNHQIEEAYNTPINQEDE